MSVAGVRVVGCSCISQERVKNCSILRPQVPECRDDFAEELIARREKIIPTSEAGWLSFRMLAADWCKDGFVTVFALLSSDF